MDVLHVYIIGEVAFTWMLESWKQKAKKSARLHLKNFQGKAPLIDREYMFSTKVKGRSNNLKNSSCSIHNLFQEHKNSCRNRLSYQCETFAQFIAEPVVGEFFNYYEKVRQGKAWRNNNQVYKFTFTRPVILEGHPNIIGNQKSLFNPFWVL